MAYATLIPSITLGLLSNIVAELLLAFDLGRPFTVLDRAHKQMRLARWVVSMIGLVLVGLFHPSPIKLPLLALFNVSAGTDLETTFLPPDWFLYSSTVAGLLVGYAVGGVGGLRDAVVAQAVCFAMMIFAVLLANAADSGDIKLLMQYGAACGSLTAVGIGIALECVVRLGLLLAVFSIALVTKRNVPFAFSRALGVRAPHGPIAWIGLLGVFILTAVGS